MVVTRQVVVKLPEMPREQAQPKEASGGEWTAALLQAGWGRGWCPVSRKDKLHRESGVKRSSRPEYLPSEKKGPAHLPDL